MSIEASQIIASYAKFSSDFIRIKTDKMRESANKKVKYFDVDININGKFTPLKIKLRNETVSNGVSKPEDRKYEQIKLSFREQTDFTKAITIINSAFESKVEELMSSKKITNKAKDAKDGCILVPSVDPKGPVQESVTDKDGEFKSLDNPIIWVSMPFKRYKDTDNLKQLGFSYKEGQSPFMVKKFDLGFVNFGTGKMINTELDNVTVTDAITRGTIISGTIRMYCVVSVQGGFCLKTEFNSKIYYITNENSNIANDDFDEDDFSEMLAIANSRAPAKSAEEDTQQEVDFGETKAVDTSGIEGLILE